MGMPYAAPSSDLWLDVCLVGLRTGAEIPNMKADRSLSWGR